jgi:hypothetical protein
MMRTPESNDFLHGLLALGMREPELVRDILGRLSDEDRSHMRGASRACRTLVNNNVTCVALGSCDELQTTDITRIFPNADGLQLWIEGGDPGFEEQLSPVSASFLGKLRSLDISHEHSPPDATCHKLLPRCVQPAERVNMPLHHPIQLFAAPMLTCRVCGPGKTQQLDTHVTWQPCAPGRA